jgi:hypothetical protein
MGLYPTFTRPNVVNRDVPPCEDLAPEKVWWDWITRSVPTNRSIQSLSSQIRDWSNNPLTILTNCTRPAVVSKITSNVELAIPLAILWSALIKSGEIVNNRCNHTTTHKGFVYLHGVGSAVQSINNIN